MHAKVTREKKDQKARDEEYVQQEKHTISEIVYIFFLLI